MARTKTTIKALFSLGLILWLIKSFDWASFFKIVLAVDIKWLLPLILLAPLAVILLSFRWYVILKTLGLPLVFGDVIKGAWSGIFFNTFLPGATGGDIYRLIFVRDKYIGEEAKIASSLMIDRITGVVSLGMLGLVGILVNKALLQHISLGITDFRLFTLLCVLFLLVLVGIGIWIFLFKADSTSWLGRIKMFIIDGIIHTKLGLFNWSLLSQVIPISIVIHLVNFTGAYCLTFALGLEVPFLDLVLFLPILSILTALPITISGFGVREALLIGFFQMRDFNLGGGVALRESALAFSFLMVTCDLFRAAPGGIWFAFGKGAKSRVMQGSYKS